MATAELTEPMPRHYGAPTRTKRADDAVTAKVKDRRLEVAEAAQLRAHETDPDVVAWRVERTQKVVERFVYAAILCALAFTMTNVQQFAAQGLTTSELGWYAAWLLDPVVSLGLIGILIAGRALAKTDVGLGPWCRRAQWALLALTYGMNTWGAWGARSGHDILLHSVPPLVAFALVESLAELRGRFAIAVGRAHAQAVDALQAPPTPKPQPTLERAPAAAAVETTPEAPVPANGRPSTTANADDPAWLDYATSVVDRLDAEHGRQVGRAVVQPELGCGTPVAAALLRAVRQRQNGDAPRLTAVN